MVMYIFHELAAVFEAFWPVLAIAAGIDTTIGLTALGVWLYRKRKNADSDDE